MENKDWLDEFWLAAGYFADFAIGSPERIAAVEKMEAMLSDLWVKAHEDAPWAIASLATPPHGVPVMFYHPDWIDPDFCPDGIREGFYNGNGTPEDWTSARWNNDQDVWVCDHQQPAHWRSHPALGKGESDG